MSDYKTGSDYRIPEGEQKDIEILKQEVQKEKIACFDRLKMISRMHQGELKAAGYSCGNEDAVYQSFMRSLQKVEKLFSAHVKKYPDK